MLTYNIIVQALFFMNFSLVFWWEQNDFAFGHFCLRFADAILPYWIYP